MKLSDIMVFVEGGTFKMGDHWDGPEHDVNLNDFYIGKFEVTQAQFEAVMGLNKSFFRYIANPVETVSWYDALNYCNKLSEIEGLQKCYKIEKDTQNDFHFKVECDFNASGYRLPTEAEWEYAAKGGKYSKGYQYSGRRNSEEVGWCKWQFILPQFWQFKIAH